MDLSNVLKARSIAIIGASEKNSFGSDACNNILTYKKDLSRVYFVNKSRDYVYGRKCYPSLIEIDDTIDLVMICTPQATVPSILRDANSKGCRAAVVVASGYSEMGTEEAHLKEQELKSLAVELDIAIMGPNCIGFVNYMDDVYAFGCPVQNRDRKGNIGFISQSGQFCISVMDSPNMKFSYSISVGNCSMIQIEDYIDFLVDDDETKVVAIYLEGVTSPEKFEASLRKAALKRKPVVVLKAGRSEKGAALAASHTGTLAGSDKSYDAIFKKFGVIRVDDLQDLLTTSLLFATLPVIPEKAAFVSINLSGGETGICADMGHLFGVPYADLSHETKTRLKQLFPFSAPSNPYDSTSTAAYNAELFSECLSTILNDDAVSMAIIGMTIFNLVEDPSLEIMYEGMRNVISSGMRKPMAILSFIESTRNQGLSCRFEQLGVPILAAPKYAFASIKYLADFINYRPETKSLQLALPIQGNQYERRALSEYESKRFLQQYGLKVDPGFVATTRSEVVQTANKIGYPIAMKVESADILHKSDIGGVKLNLCGEEEALDAYDQIIQNAALNAPQAKVQGVLMQKMFPKGLEVILGIKNDPQFGPMLMVGLGGVFVEVFKDFALYPVPVNRDEAMEMLTSLKAFKLMTGYRGGQTVDLEALTEAMVSLSAIADRNRDCLLEMDINPLIVFEERQGVGVADALVILKERNKGDSQNGRL